jgi:probable O-glycosylation ligase (exosortase A-associated)
VRDLIVALAILSLIPVSYRRPFIGLLTFSWLAYMRVQDLAWGFAQSMRWSYYVSIVMVAGFIVQRRDRWFLPDWRIWTMFAMVGWVILSAALSDLPPAARETQIDRVVEFIKIIGIAVFTTAVVRTREHLRLLIWIIALSFAFYGVKDGVWGLLKGFGGRIIQGPGGMIADNNDYALALVMSVTMLFSIAQAEARPVLRRAFYAMVPLSIITVLLTYSRGGLLSLITGTLVMVWRSPFRWRGLIAGAVATAVVLAVMPQEMYDRFASIKTYQDDGSAQSRFRSWAVGYRMALDNPVFGVGLQGFRSHYMKYEPNPTPEQLTGDGTKVAHNSYIQMWAECGTPSLLMYLSLIAGSFWTVWRIRRKARRIYEDSWILHYCTMFESSLAAFMVGSAFLNRAHFDLIYHWFAIIAMFGVFAERDMADATAGVRRDKGRGTLRVVPERGFRPVGAGAVPITERGFGGRD